MAKTSVVKTLGGETAVVVQGFKRNDELGIEPYVFLGVDGGGEWADIEANLSPEDAHILSEEIRKHAEFAQSVREEGKND